MKKFSIFLLFCLFSLNANAKFTIFTCEVEWASLAREIVRDKADVVVALHPLKNPDSYVNISSSLIKKMVDADMVVCAGAGIEDGWLPKLLKRSSNQKIRSGEAVLMIQIRFKTANPSAKKSVARLHLNPYNIVKIADEFTRVVRILDPKNSVSYQKNLENFNNRWFVAVQKWQQDILAIKDMSVIVKDDSWNHMSRWLDLRIVGRVEEVSGVRPTKKELKELSSLIKEKEAKVIIAGLNQNKEDVFYLSKESGVKVVTLPFTVKGVSHINDLFDLFDYIILKLSVNCDGVKCKKVIKKRQCRGGSCSQLPLSSTLR